MGGYKNILDRSSHITHTNYTVTNCRISVCCRQMTIIITLVSVEEMFFTSND